MRLHLLKRSIRFWFQRRWRGWDDSETWHLGSTCIIFILPRLERYRELNNGVPADLTSEEWEAELEVMISGFRLFVDGDDCFSFERSQKIEKACELFGRRLTTLWW